MVAYRRITPNEAFIQSILDIQDRVGSLETRPAGNITIREQLSTTDPVTGVSTILGQLPDGTYGFQPFVGDIVPPPVATAPVVSAELGVFVVAWDGTFVGNAEQPKDFEHVTVFAHKMDADTVSYSVAVGVIRLPTESVFVSTDVARVGETWSFSLEAEDFNGNKAARSDRSATLTMRDPADNVTDALTDVQTKVDAANAAAADAQTKAQEALDAASSASGGAVIQDAPPSASQQKPGVLWIDTTGGNNTPKRWDGSAWVAITDKAAIDAANAAAAAKTRADQAFNNATSAATAAGNAQTSADSKNEIWYLPSAPAGNAHAQDDVWFDTSNDNRISRWNATTNTWDLSLIGNSAIFANLDAGKMTVGTLAVARLGAKSISVDKLVISSTDNLIVGADMAVSAASWQKTANITYQATAGRASTPALRFTGVTTALTSFNVTNRVTVEPDNRFRCSIFVKSSAALVAGSIKLVLRCYTSATAYTDVTAISSPALVANAWTQVTGISAALPAGTLSIEFYLSVTNDAAGTTTDIDYVSATRAADGNLVVDGAIDGKTITGALFQTTATANRGIKLDGLGFKAYDPNGKSTFSVDALTGAVSSAGTFSTLTNQVSDSSGTMTIAATFGNLDNNTGTSFTGQPGIAFTRTHSSEGVKPPATISYNGKSLIMSTLPTADGFTPNMSGASVTAGAGVATISAARSGSAYDASLPMPQLTVDAGRPDNTGYERIIMEMDYRRDANTPWVSSFEIDKNSYFTGSALVGIPAGSYMASMNSYSNGSQAAGAKETARVEVAGDSAWAISGKAASDGRQLTYLGAEPIGAAGSVRGIIRGRAEGNIQLSSQDRGILYGKNSAELNSDAKAIVSAPEVTVMSTGNYLYLQAANSVIVNAPQLSSDKVSATTSFLFNGDEFKSGRYAEFINAGWSQAGADTTWDVGPLSYNAARSKNNDFVNVGSGNGKIAFTKTGYYSLSVIQVPNGSMGSSWIRFNNTTQGKTIMQMANAGYMWEQSCVVPATLINAGDVIWIQTQAQTARTTSCTVAIRRLFS